MSTRNRVLIFSSARVLGGGEVYVIRVAKGLHNEFRISVFADRQLLSQLEAPVSTFRFARFPRAIERHLPGGYRLRHAFYHLRYARRSVLDRNHADLVHFQIYDERLFDLFLPRLIRQAVPRIITIQTEFTAEQVKTNKYRPQEFLPHFSAIICACNNTKANLIKCGIPPERCHVIYNGVDVLEFTPSQKPGRFVTWVGRVDEQDKNPMLFVRIAELAHRRQLSYRFRIVGDGPLVPIIRNYVAERRIQNLEVNGWAENIQQVYRDAQVLCMTSVSEAIPLVLSEAMASGVPVIASRVGGIPELIKDDSVGVLVDGFGEPEFLDAIAAICEDSARYGAVRRNARNWIEQSFSLDKMLAETATVYTTLLGE
jgi:glycosyltransferase involved in cell wall biosynthesis